MNRKRCLLAGFGVFAAYFAMEFFVHGVLLKDLYQRTEGVWRPEEYMRKLTGFMVLGQFIFSLVFAHIYAKGYDASKPGARQGLRYGILIGLLLAPMSSLVWYVILPIPEILPVLWFLSGMIEYALIGIVAGLMYRV